MLIAHLILTIAGVYFRERTRVYKRKLELESSMRANEEEIESRTRKEAEKRTFTEIAAARRPHDIDPDTEEWPTDSTDSRVLLDYERVPLGNSGHTWVRDRYQSRRGSSGLFFSKMAG